MGEESKHKKINFNNRQFVGVVNYGEGEFTTETIFQYRQKGDIVWGTYQGGGVKFGMLIATVADDSSLDMRWQHVNTNNQLRTGICKSVPEVLSDGRIRLYESWQTTDDTERSGTSIAEELSKTNFSEVES